VNLHGHGPSLIQIGVSEDVDSAFARKKSQRVEKFGVLQLEINGARGDRSRLGELCRCW
jgi:hypothetical protein